jgi:pimeloyl-ACP methyl ester carboxylesterase
MARSSLRAALARVILSNDIRRGLHHVNIRNIISSVGIKIMSSRERLVFVRTPDGLTLDGALVEPDAAARTADPQADLSADRSANRPAPLIWLHGQHLGFSEPEYVALARVFAARGRPVLLAGTRGKGFGAWHRTADGARLGGSGWELFQECLIDIGAWVDWLQPHGGDRVVLAGHGYGGTKAVYHAAQKRDPRIAAVIAASTGSLVRDTLDPQQLELAQRMVADGRGRDLMPFGTLRGSMQATVSAAAYVNRVQVHRDVHGSARVAPALTQVTCPLLAFFGALEQTPERDVDGFLQSITRNATASPLVERALIPGAGYFFAGAEAAVADRIEQFLARALPQRAERSGERPQEAAAPQAKRTTTRRKALV